MLTVILSAYLSMRKPDDDFMPIHDLIITSVTSDDPPHLKGTVRLGWHKDVGAAWDRKPSVYLAPVADGSEAPDPRWDWQSIKPVHYSFSIPKNVDDSNIEGVEVTFDITTPSLSYALNGYLYIGIAGVANHYEETSFVANSYLLGIINGSERKKDRFVFDAMRTMSAGDRSLRQGGNKAKQAYRLYSDTVVPINLLRRPMLSRKPEHHGIHQPRNADWNPTEFYVAPGQSIAFGTANKAAWHYEQMPVIDHNNSSDHELTVDDMVVGSFLLEQRGYTGTEATAGKPEAHWEWSGVIRKATAVPMP